MKKPLIIKSGGDVIISLNGMKRVMNSKSCEGKTNDEIITEFLKERGIISEEN